MKTLLTVIHGLVIYLTERPARVHCGQVLSSGIAGLIGRMLFEIPYVVYVYGSETVRLGRQGMSRWLMRAVLRKSEWVVAISEFTASEFLAFGVDRRQLRFISPGVDTGRFRPGEPDGELVERFRPDWTNARGMTRSSGRWRRWARMATIWST